MNTAVGCCGTSTKMHKGKSRQRTPFTSIEAVAFDKALRGIKLVSAEWEALRSIRVKMLNHIVRPDCRYRLIQTTISDTWIELFEDDDYELVLRRAMKHTDDRFSRRIWDNKKLEYVYRHEGTEWRGD